MVAASCLKYSRLAVTKNNRSAIAFNKIASRLILGDTMPSLKLIASLLLAKWANVLSSALYEATGNSKSE